MLRDFYLFSFFDIKGSSHDDYRLRDNDVRGYKGKVHLRVPATPFKVDGCGWGEGRS